MFRGREKKEREGVVGGEEARRRAFGERRERGRDSRTTVQPRHEHSRGAIWYFIPHSGVARPFRCYPAAAATTTPENAEGEVEEGEDEAEED